MHLIDQDLSGINQLGAVVGAISGYLYSKQFGQLCLPVDRQIICSEKNSLQIRDMAAVQMRKKTHPIHCMMVYPPLLHPICFSTAVVI